MTSDRVHVADREGSVVETGRVKVGDLILTTRTARRQKQDEAARLLGVTQQQLSKWEAGTNRPGVRHADAIAAYLGRALPEVLLLIHADHTGRTTVDPTLADRLDTIEQTSKSLLDRFDDLLQTIEDLRRRPGR